MSRVAIVTDSNSGISQEEAKKLGVYVVPMPFFVNGRVYLKTLICLRSSFISFWQRTRTCLLLSRLPPTSWICGMIF